MLTTQHLFGKIRNVDVSTSSEEGIKTRNRFEEFTSSIIELNRCLQKIKEAEMAKFGLRAGHVMCMYYLARHEEGLIAAQLTEYCREDKAAVSRCLNLLAEKGLVRRELPPNKRSYRTVHYLTDEGRRIASEIDERINAAVSFGGEGLCDEQREAFYGSMEIILKNLSRYLENQEGTL